VMAGAAYLFAPRVAYDYGEGPNMGESFMASGTRHSSRHPRMAPRFRTGVGPGGAGPGRRR
jgi:hypothetical protein